MIKIVIQLTSIYKIILMLQMKAVMLGTLNKERKVADKSIKMLGRTQIKADRML